MISSGCKTSTSYIDPCYNNFECEFKLNDSDICGHLEVTEDGVCIFNFEAPTELSGTKITVDNQDLTVTTDGYTYKFQKDDIPRYSFVNDVHHALISATDYSLNHENDKLTFIEDNGKIELKFNQLGMLISIYIENSDIEIIMTNPIKN